MLKSMLKRFIIISIAINFLSVWITEAKAQPTIVETDWTLIRTIDFANPQAAHYNPVDGRIYVGSNNAIFKIHQNGYAENIAPAFGPEGIVIDPNDGDIFFSEDGSGIIFRIAFGGNGRTVWVSGFHSDDDDPAGMAIAPNGYSGSVLAPGEALVVDWGYNGLDEVWRWSPDVSEGEVPVHVDNGTLIYAADITIGDSDVYLVDGGDAASGSIYRLNTDGSLTLITTNQIITNPLGVTIDPIITGNLFVLDAGANRIVRVDITSGEVSNMFTGFSFSSQNFAGIDVNPDGTQIIISDEGGNSIHFFGLCDATAYPEEDCNSNGIRDFCDIALDPSTDCNENGIPDECDIINGDCDGNGIPDECLVCPSVQIVFIMDTSSSMTDEGEALCNTISHVVTALQSMGTSTEVALFSIVDDSISSGCHEFSCLVNNVADTYGTGVPGDPPLGLETLGNCSGSPEVPCEDWGLATAVVAGEHPWSPPGESIRIIVPLADEGPWCGNPVTDKDVDSINHAIRVAQNHNVIVSPITGNGSVLEVVALAQRLADETRGSHFSSTEPDADIALGIINLVLDACEGFVDCNDNGVPDQCDIPPICMDTFCSKDDDEDGVPDECREFTIFPQITECPVVETECPPVETLCYIQHTVCPVYPTWCPDNDPTQCAITVCTGEGSGETYCPLEPTICPTNLPTVCPEDFTFCPEHPTWCPDNDPTICETTNCPEDPTLCDIGNPTVCPVPCPPGVEPTIWPLIETECPLIQTLCPLSTTICPVVDTFCPAGHTWCPEIPTTCPEVPTFCPDNDPTICEVSVCPVSDTLCPVDLTFCPLVDYDEDGIIDCEDNCPWIPNPEQEDTIPPQGNGIGDVCDCEANFDCDYDVDAIDVDTFLDHFGRNQYFRPCTNQWPCKGDFFCDGDVDSADVTKFLEDFGRSQFFEPCSPCIPWSWCVYE